MPILYCFPLYACSLPAMPSQVLYLLAPIHADSYSPRTHISAASFPLASVSFMPHHHPLKTEAL